MPLNKTKPATEKTLTDHATWLLRALGRRSPTPIEDMEPEQTLAELEIDEFDARSLTDSMREYICYCYQGKMVGRVGIEPTTN